MENQESISIIKVREKDGNDLYIKAKWSDTNFYVWVISGEAVWEGHCTSDNVVRDSERYAETVENYRNTARSCLTSYDDKFRYELKSEGPHKVLLWKIQEARLRVCGSLRLSSCKDSAVSEIRSNFLDYLLETNKQMTARLEEYTEQKRVLQNELTKSLENLNEVAKLKNESEANLYGHIIQLLNSYKRRIALLEEQVGGDG